MSIYSTPQDPPKRKPGRPKGSKNKNPYPLEARKQISIRVRAQMGALTPEERSERARFAALSGTQEERSERARNAAKALWTEEYKKKKSIYNKKRGIAPPPRKGKKNKKPYPVDSPKVKQRVEDYIAGIANGDIILMAAYKGRFVPSHPEKYDGDPTNIIYRSQLELRFMQYLDTNSGVLKWQSEETIVPYRDPTSGNRLRRYFPDFVVTTKQGTTMVEVKPSKQCVEPKGKMHQDGRKNRRLLKEQLTYAKNLAKWEAAKSYCADRKWKFQLVTEKDLGGW